MRKQTPTVFTGGSARELQRNIARRETVPFDWVFLSNKGNMVMRWNPDGGKWLLFEQAPYWRIVRNGKGDVRHQAFRHVDPELPLEGRPA